MKRADEIMVCLQRSGCFIDYDDALDLAQIELTKELKNIVKEHNND